MKLLIFAQHHKQVVQVPSKLPIYMYVYEFYIIFTLYLEPDQDSEWEHKLSEVRAHLCELLPLAKAAELFELYSCHVNARKGIKPNSVEARAYRKLLELEEAILLWEELQKEQKTSSKSLLTKMKEVGFPGMEKIQVFQDESELQNLLS